MHRDIKLENVLLCTPLNSSGPQYYYCSALPPAPLPKQVTASNDRVLAKLADFGLAVHLAPGEKTVGTAGSRPYEAPEVILGQEYDMKADVWSLGVLLFGMLSCAMPFQGHGDRQLIRQILRGNVDLSRGAWSAVSAEAKDLIRAMLSVNPDERISMAQVVAHPWIKAASRRKPVVTTLFAGTGAIGALSPAVSSSLTPRTPVDSLVSPPGYQKDANVSDLPSLDPCSRDDEDANEKNRLVAGEGDEGSCGLFEKNADQDADVASRKKRDGMKDKENACPPVHPTAARGVAGDAALGPSIVLQAQAAGGAEKQDIKEKASFWDSFLPALGPSRGKWRMGF
ncbi:unnamed protein product [Closterium sp. Yama58-4]|nr:unnamed protein product [Closterium sp. Yama58-4]